MPCRPRSSLYVTVRQLAPCDPFRQLTSSAAFSSPDPPPSRPAHAPPTTHALAARRSPLAPADVDTNLLGTGKVNKAAILGQAGGVWATSPGYDVRAPSVRLGLRVGRSARIRDGGCRSATGAM